MEGITSVLCSGAGVAALALATLQGIVEPTAAAAQEASAAVSRDTVLAAARELMASTTYCALVTTDSLGRPQVRTMNPFPPDEGMVVRFGTNRHSRKVQEIRRSPHVCVYYANHVEAQGYVSISGTARIVDDRAQLLAHKREYWESIPSWQDVMLLIEVVPERIEVINYKHGLNNDPVTWKAPEAVF